MNKIGTGVLWLAMLGMLQQSCAVLRKGEKKQKKQKSGTLAVRNDTMAPVITVVPVPTPGKNIEYALPLWTKRKDYRTFSAKTKVSFQGPDNSADFSANIRMTRDSILWIHVTALGGLYPVARMLVTADSFFLINHIEKEAYMLPLAEAGKVLPVPVTLRQMQNMIVGDPIANGKMVNAEVKENAWALEGQDDTWNQQLTINAADSALLNNNINTLKPGGPQVFMTYTTFSRIAEKMIAANRTIRIMNGLNNYTLEMLVTNAEFEKAMEYPFSIPKNYTVQVK
jgi:hypothetical protein